jgi:hypothetical protein
MERKTQRETDLEKGSLSYLSKRRSKKGLTRRPLFLVKVKSLVCTGEMIGPNRSAAGAGGMRSRSSGAACLGASFWCYIRALALWELRLFAISFSCFSFAPSLDVLRRIARERVPCYHRNGIA